MFINPAILKIMYKNYNLNLLVRTLLYSLNVIFIFALAYHGSKILSDLDEMTQDKNVILSVKYFAPFYITNPTVFVFAMFWVLYAIDRELVFPAVYDQIIPWWFNQCVHTNILVLVVVEHILQARRRPTDQKCELIINAALGIAYAVVYYAIYFFTNRWLYNVFGVMTWWQVCLFQILIWTSTYVFYRIQFPLNRLIHGPEPEVEKTVQISTENNQKSNRDVIEEDKARNGEFANKNGEFSFKNGEFTFKNGDYTANNGKVNEAFDGDDIDSKLPFSSKSWSLKYRNMRQSEHTNL